MTLPSNTPTTTVGNVRIPTAWYRHLEEKGKKENLSVHSMVMRGIRRVVDQATEQQRAIENGYSVTAVRQRALAEAYPDLPKWDYPPSAIRNNTPTSEALSARETKYASGTGFVNKRYQITVPVSQAVYYGLRRIAAARSIETEVFARQILTHQYQIIEAASVGDNNDD